MHSCTWFIFIGGCFHLVPTSQHPPLQAYSMLVSLFFPTTKFSPKAFMGQCDFPWQKIHMRHNSVKLERTFRHLVTRIAVLVALPSQFLYRYDAYINSTYVHFMLERWKHPLEEEQNPKTTTNTGTMDLGCENVKIR